MYGKYAIKKQNLKKANWLGFLLTLWPPYKVKVTEIGTQY